MTKVKRTRDHINSGIHRRRYKDRTGRRGIYITLDEIREERIRRYGIEDPEEATFFDLLHKDQFHYFMIEQLDSMIKNGGDKFPIDFHFIVRQKLMASYFIFALDLFGKPTFFTKVSGISHKTMLNYLRPLGLTDYYYKAGTKEEIEVNL